MIGRMYIFVLLIGCFLDTARARRVCEGTLYSFMEGGDWIEKNGAGSGDCGGDLSEFSISLTAGGSFCDCRCCFPFVVSAFKKMVWEFWSLGRKKEKMPVGIVSGRVLCFGCDIFLLVVLLSP